MTKTTKKQTDEVEFDVMVADESHEKYVDTNLLRTRIIAGEIMIIDEDWFRCSVVPSRVPFA